MPSPNALFNASLLLEYNIFCLMVAVSGLLQCTMIIISGVVTDSESATESARISPLSRVRPNLEVVKNARCKYVLNKILSQIGECAKNWLFH